MSDGGSQTRGVNRSDHNTVTLWCGATPGSWGPPPPHLQLGVQVSVGRHHMLVLLLPCHLDERLLGLPEPPLELVDHGLVLALHEAVHVVPGVAAGRADREGKSGGNSLKHPPRPPPSHPVLFCFFN